MPAFRCSALKESRALDLVRSLDPGQLAQAVVRPSIHTADIPLSLQDPFDAGSRAYRRRQRHPPHPGVPARDLSDVALGA